MTGISLEFRNDGYKLKLIPRFNKYEEYKPIHLSIGSETNNKSIRMSVQEAAELSNYLLMKIEEVKGSSKYQ
ncbi:MAG: hypothetical protein WCS33_00310 [Candidatus Caldatribacteriota bacterium]|jgi:hypothetical protein